ncbi:MAG: DNA repair protein RadA [Gammaproteobacteria bacterium]|nr:DNA repair protein RadA [Gammaproteobacteria bacterium]MDH4254446.1 DNA repair protein RadA [Gammaproteobacteria bacterium]MDH5309401.1 DNA repair protein RadA [Gammaproteobacteria bacterium]
MSKPRTAYVCTACGAHSVKWQGQCPDCDAWNTLEQTAIAATPRNQRGSRAPARLADLIDDPDKRFPTGFAEFDRVLGGGLVPGSVVLLGGDPGVGKSTLLQQVAGRLPPGLNVCYATGEESLRQVAQRSHRIGMENTALRLLADTSLDNILQQATEARAQVIVIDSIQTVIAETISSAPGSVSQLRECVGRIVQHAKQNEVTVLLIGHVTKEGAIAGPRVVEHMVDTVLYFESDPSSRYTVVRAVKNRFGASSEMGVFAMTEGGFREVSNPSAIFLSGHGPARPGSVISVAWEGSRPLLVEIQALVAEGVSNYPKRLAQGVDQSRLALLVAVLQRHGGLALTQEDIFVNVVGGLRIGETAADLPVLISVVSSFRDRPPAEGLVSFGEVGLAGEVRPVRFGTERLAETAKQGFKRAIVPRANLPRRKLAGLTVIPVDRLTEALAAAFED